MKHILLLLTFIPLFTIAQTNGKKTKVKETKNEESTGIRWISFNEAVKLSQTTKKKILIDVYTDWCGWCKRMDATTYENKKIIEYINANFYAVKLDAEMKDTIVFNNHTFVTTDATNKKAPHQIAVALLNGKMGYPSTVFLDEGFNMITPVQGYLDIARIEMYLKFIASDLYKTKKLEEYEPTFKSEFAIE